jgi:hypothetical protein
MNRLTAPPDDFPGDFYERTMHRTQLGRAHDFNQGTRGKRARICTQWTDGCAVGRFVDMARPCGGGAGDLRIYVAKELVTLDPPLTAVERNRVLPYRATAK